MPGPCTLLVEPHNQTYTDADGVQVLPWHEIAFAKRRLTHAAGVANIQTPAEQWAYSFRTKLSSTPIQMVDAVTAWNATAQAFYTAVSATKTYPHISEVVTWMDANIADIDDQQFWAVLGRFYAHGTGHNGTLSIIKLVSTGGDVTLTLPSNVASSSYGGGAIVLNTSANDRAIRFIANGTETATTIPNTLPAGSYRHVRGSGGAVSIGHALGIKIAGTLADETFYVLQMGFVNESSADPFGPFVHTTGSDIPDTLFFDPNTLNPVDVFAGTNFVLARSDHGATHTGRHEFRGCRAYASGLPARQPHILVSLGVNATGGDVRLPAGRRRYYIETASIQRYRRCHRRLYVVYYAHQ
jgi:hypothetical protein